MQDLLIPETWGITGSQAKKVKAALNNKSTRPEDAVQKGLGEIARDIAIIEPDPSDWGWWVAFLLEQLEIHAEKRRLTDNYEHTLANLIDNLQKRVEGGRW